MSIRFNRLFALLLLILFVIGTLKHLLPLTNEQNSLYSITEDGYLMMTIARNLALGLGMSTAEGTLPTNGTQPLVTFLWAGFYWLENGDKFSTITWIIVTQWLIAIAAALMLWKLVTTVLHQRSHYAVIAGLTACAWFASPVAAKHSMNGLETGLYGLAVIVVAWLVTTIIPRLTWRHSVLLGVILGIVFWIRNDASFLILATCLLYLQPDGQSLTKRFGQVVLMGATSILIASPWLIYNKLSFGHLMPISGQAQALTAELGHNLPALPAVLLEYLLVFLPIPDRLQQTLPVILLAIILLFIVTIAITKSWVKFYSIERRLILFISLYLIGLSSFYGLYFGADYFISRYLFPISAFFTLLWVVFMVRLWYAIPANGIRYGLVIVFIGITASLLIRSYEKQEKHQHFHVVEWVKANVKDNEWVAAIQSGTLGYFHDRTINLDGKVNPEALTARQQDRLIEYIIDKKVDYLVDWLGIADWMDRYPLLREHFTILVKDPQRGKKGLAVLKRIEHSPS